MKKMKLSDLCDILIGRTPSRNISEYWGKGYKWVSISDMKEEIITSTKEEITESAIKSIRCRKIPKGTLMLSFKLSIGKLAFAGTDLYTNEAIASLLIKDESILNSKYLYYVLKSINFVGGNQAAMGTTLNSKSLAALIIPVPSIEDQIRIAIVLSLAENLIGKRKKSIQMLDELLKSVFFEMFGPKSIEYHKWPVVEIKDLAELHKGSMRTGPFGSNLLHSEFIESGDVAVLGIDNAVQNKFAWNQRRYITMDKYSELTAYRVFPGDVIITIMGTVGRSAVIPDDIPLAINTKHLAAITLDKQKANPIFLSYSIHSNPYIINQFTSKNRGAIMNGLNLGLIKETKLRKPPIELQNKFADIANKVENLKNKYTQNLVELENLYGSLNQRAFNGELDLSKIVVGEKINEIDLQQEMQLSISDIDEMVEAKKYSEFELDTILKSQDVNGFTFESLMNDIVKVPFHVMPDYDYLKAQIYNRLAGTSPMLLQEYDDKKNEMILRLRI